MAWPEKINEIMKMWRAYIAANKKLAKTRISENGGRSGNMYESNISSWRKPSAEIMSKKISGNR
jgi:hypothetical protein